MEAISFTLSILAIIISIYVAILQFKQERREKERFKQEKIQNKKDVSFSISEINYSFERNIDQINNEVIEDHIVDFDFYIQNRGIPTIYLDKAGVIPTKALLGVKINSFTLSIPEDQNKLDTGEKCKLRFARGFETREIAYEIINSHNKIKCLDLQGHLFSSNLIKPIFGDSI